MTNSNAKFESPFSVPKELIHIFKGDVKVKGKGWESYDSNCEDWPRAGCPSGYLQEIWASIPTPQLGLMNSTENPQRLELQAHK